MSDDYREFGRVLARVSHGMKTASGEPMRALGVYAGQNFLLEQLWREDGLSPGELARRIGIETPSVTRAAQRMENAGLVRRVPDPEDARLVRVTLTERGWQLRHELPAAMDAVAARALEGLTSEQRAALIDLLQRVEENLHGSTTST